MALTPSLLLEERPIPDDDEAAPGPGRDDPGSPVSSVLPEAVRNLRALILAGEHYRQTLSGAIGLGTTESQALSYLAVHGESGQSVLARDLGLTSSASTALVDRLERQGVAERVPHPHDRRRLIVRLTDRGRAVVDESYTWLAATLEQVDPAELAQVSGWLAFLADDLRDRTTARQREGWRGSTHALPA